MTLTIEISKELEDRLEAEAESKGIGKDEFVRVVLEEKLNSAPTQGKRPPFESKIIATDLPVKDRSREREWLNENRDKFAGQWIALDGNKLIASNVDGREVVKKAKELGLKSLFIHFVEASDEPPFISGGVW